MNGTFISHSYSLQFTSLYCWSAWDSESRHHEVCAEWMGSRSSLGVTDCRAMVVRSGHPCCPGCSYLCTSWNDETVFSGCSTLFHQHYFPEGVVSCLAEWGDKVWSYELMSQKGHWGLWVPGEGARIHSSKEVQTHSGGWWIWQLILVCLTAGTFFASFITSGEVFHTCAM